MESKVVNRVSIKPPEASNSDYSSVMGKLFFFTLLMVIAPISTYFLSLEHYFGATNTTGAAISAAAVANLILIGFIVIAFLEKDAEIGQESRKSQ